MENDLERNTVQAYINSVISRIHCLYIMVWQYPYINEVELQPPTLSRNSLLFMAARAAAAPWWSVNSTNAYGSFPGCKKKKHHSQLFPVRGCEGVLMQDCTVTPYRGSPWISSDNPRKRWDIITKQVTIASFHILLNF
jgi:hypothetical protein